MIKEIATLKNDNARLNKEIASLSSQLRNTSVLNSSDTSNILLNNLENKS